MNADIKFYREKWWIWVGFILKIIHFSNPPPPLSLDIVTLDTIFDIVASRFSYILRKVLVFENSHSTPTFHEKYT